MIYTPEIVLFIVLYVAMLGVLFHLVYLMDKDSKLYRKALKNYLEESVKDGQDRARAKSLGALQEDRAAKLRATESIKKAK